MSGTSKDSDVMVVTRSILRAWWLRRVLRYKLESVHKTPQQDWFGSIYYKTEWVLSRRGNNE